MAGFESPPMRAVFKFFLPLMGILSLSIMLWGNDKKAWAILPTLVIILYATAADLRMKGEHIYYRYFLSWKKLPKDISDVRCTLLPALGYIRFKHFFPPFGLLFFIVEYDWGIFIPFQRTTTMQYMISHLRLPQNEANHLINNDIKADQINSKTRILRVLYPLAGLIAGILMPVPWQPNFATPMKSDLISLYLRIEQNSTFLFIYSAVLVVLIIRNKFHPFINFVLAFSLGAVVANLAHIH
jgi:hypothetical protein